MKKNLKKMASLKFLLHHVLSQSTGNKKQRTESSFKKIQQNATMYQVLLFHIHIKLKMFRATHRPSSGA
jgi:uncharacterized protein (UPF0276 family)